MCVGKTKALIKFNKPLFYEPGKSGKEFLHFFALHLLLFTSFFMTLNRIFTFYINQPHLFLKAIDNKKRN